MLVALVRHMRGCACPEAPGGDQGQTESARVSVEGADRVIQVVSKSGARDGAKHLGGEEPRLASRCVTSSSQVCLRCPGQQKYGGKDQGAEIVGLPVGSASPPKVRGACPAIQRPGLCRRAAEACANLPRGRCEDRTKWASFSAGVPDPSTLQKRRPLRHRDSPSPDFGHRMVSSNLYGQPPRSLHSYLHIAGKEKMDSVIDLSDAGKALDLARIRAQLM